jgi:hypothetical protein
MVECCQRVLERFSHFIRKCVAHVDIVLHLSLPTISSGLGVMKMSRFLANLYLV